MTDSTSYIEMMEGNEEQLHSPEYKMLEIKLKLAESTGNAAQDIVEDLHRFEELFTRRLPRTLLAFDRKTASFRQITSFDELSNVVEEADGRRHVDEAFLQTLASSPARRSVHFATLGLYLRHLYENDKLMDVCVNIDGTLFMAHRTALCCCSGYFSELLGIEKNHKLPVHVKILGISPAAFRTFLEFVYTGELKIPQGLMAEMVLISNYLKAKSLANKLNVSDFTLSLQEAVKLLQSRKLNMSHALFSAAYSKVLDEFMSAVKMHGFLDLNVDTFCDLIASDNLRVPTEYDVFRITLRWIVHGASARLQHVTRVMALIRFAYMSKSELFDCLGETKLFLENSELKSLLLIANWILTAVELKRTDPFCFIFPPPRKFYIRHSCLEPMKKWKTSQNTKYADTGYYFKSKPETVDQKQMSPRGYAKPVMMSPESTSPLIIPEIQLPKQEHTVTNPNIEYGKPVLPQYEPRVIPMPSQNTNSEKKTQKRAISPAGHSKPTIWSPQESNNSSNGPTNSKEIPHLSENGNQSSNPKRTLKSFPIRSLSPNALISEQSMLNSIYKSIQARERRTPVANRYIPKPGTSYQAREQGNPECSRVEEISKTFKQKREFKFQKRISPGKPFVSSPTDYAKPVMISPLPAAVPVTRPPKPCDQIQMSPPGYAKPVMMSPVHVTKSPNTNVQKQVSSPGYAKPVMMSPGHVTKSPRTSDQKQVSPPGYAKPVMMSPGHVTKSPKTSDQKQLSPPGYAKPVMMSPGHVTKSPKTSDQKQVSPPGYAKPVMMSPGHVTKSPKTSDQKQVSPPGYAKPVMMSPGHVNKSPKTSDQKQVSPPGYAKPLMMSPGHVTKSPKTSDQKQVSPPGYAKPVMMSPVSTAPAAMQLPHPPEQNQTVIHPVSHEYEKPIPSQIPDAGQPNPTMLSPTEPNNKVPFLTENDNQSSNPRPTSKSFPIRSLSTSVQRSETSRQITTFRSISVREVNMPRENNPASKWPSPKWRDQGYSLSPIPSTPMLQNMLPTAVREDSSIRTSQNAKKKNSSPIIIAVGSCEERWLTEHANQFQGKERVGPIQYHNIPYSRRYFAVAMVTPYLYVTGGYNPSSEATGVTSSVFVMNCRCKEWRTAESMLGARMCHSACAIENKVYVFGGLDEHERPLSSCECYDTFTNQWSAITPMPVALYAGAVTSVGGRCYLAGGMTRAGLNDSLRVRVKLICYDPQSNKWADKGYLRMPLCHASLVNVQGRLFLCGGATEHRERGHLQLKSVSTIDEYNLMNNTCSFRATMSSPRHETNVAVIGSRLYFIGGKSSAEEHICTKIECFDTRDSKWIKCGLEMPFPARWIQCATYTEK